MRGIILPDDDAPVALRPKMGRRRELIQTRNIALMRGLLCGIHPRLEQTLEVACKAPLAPLVRYFTPAEIRSASAARLVGRLSRTPQLRGIAVPGVAATAAVIREPASESLEARATTALIVHSNRARSKSTRKIRSVPRRSSDPSSATGTPISARAASGGLPPSASAATI
jgi:hypothetical protein